MSFSINDGRLEISPRTFSNQAHEIQRAIENGSDSDYKFVEQYRKKHERDKSPNTRRHSDIRMALARLYGVGNDSVLVESAKDEFDIGSIEDSLSRLSKKAALGRVRSQSDGVTELTWAHMLGLIAGPATNEWQNNNSLIGLFLKEMAFHPMIDAFPTFGGSNRNEDISFLSEVDNKLSLYRIPRPWNPLDYRGTVRNSRYARDRLEWGLWSNVIDLSDHEGIVESAARLSRNLTIPTREFLRNAIHIVDLTDVMYQSGISIQEILAGSEIAHIYRFCAVIAKDAVDRYIKKWKDAIPVIEVKRYLAWALRIVVEAPPSLHKIFEQWIQNELPLCLINVGQVLEQAGCIEGELTREYESRYFKNAPNAIRLIRPRERRRSEDSLSEIE